MSEYVGVLPGAKAGQVVMPKPNCPAATKGAPLGPRVGGGIGATLHRDTLVKADVPKPQTQKPQPTKPKHPILPLVAGGVVGAALGLAAAWALGELAMICAAVIFTLLFIVSLGLLKPTLTAATRTSLLETGGALGAAVAGAGIGVGAVYLWQEMADRWAKPKKH